MQFNSSEFENFLQRLGDAKAQVDSILEGSIGADKISEASMLLVWHSLFDVLLTVEKPEDRLKFSVTMKEMFSALNSRRANERKTSKSDEAAAAKPPLDPETFTDLQEKLKLL